MAEVTPEWVAGFFDGEGTVDIRLRRTHGGKYIRFELRAQIVQRDPMPLLMIAEVFGGSIQKAKGHSCSMWVATGPTAAKFLETISQHTICKTDQIAVALRFQKRIAHPAQTMTDSNRRGFARLPQSEVDARLALVREIRGIRDNAGLRPKARNYSLQAEAAVLGIPREREALEDRSGAQACGENRGLH